MSTRKSPSAWARARRTDRAPARRPPRPAPAPPAHRAPRDALTVTTEDYLERIDELIERKGYARVVDIAERLEVSQPSVTAMVKRLADAGYLRYEKYRGLIMTEPGRAVAHKIKSRHAVLKRFLSLLGVDEPTQETDIEGLEHSLSPTTLERLADLVEFFEQNPRLLHEALSGR